MPAHDLIIQECMKKFADGDKRMSNLEDTTTSLKSDIGEMKTALLGDFDKQGIITVVKQTATDIKSITTNKNGWVKWVEKLVITTLLGLILFYIKN